MEPASSMLPADEDVQRLAAPTDRRPDFIAEALSPRFRVGLLIAALLAATGLVVAVLEVAIWPGLLFGSGLPGVLLGGGTVVLTFVVLLVFGALVANNASFTSQQRMVWYAAFALFGPVMVPCYWLIHVWPARYQPIG